MDERSKVVATGCNAEPFLFPNDLCFGPDGALYLTDSGVNFDNFPPNNQIRPDYMDAHYDGRVYRVEPDTSAVTRIDEGLRFTNGIVFGPDGLLYVNETLTGNIYRYGWCNGQISFPRELLGDVIRADAPAGWTGPDSMAFDHDGLLYVSVFGQEDITVLGMSGEVVRRIPTFGRLPTNVAFALPPSSASMSQNTSHGQIETFLILRDGLSLWDGQKSE